MLSLQAPFIFQGTSTELFRWAAEKDVVVRVLVLERLLDRGDLLFREAAWTQAAIDAQWLLPGVERWGAKSKKIDGSPAQALVSYVTPDFTAIDLSRLELLSDVVVGVHPQDFGSASSVIKNAADEVEKTAIIEKHSIQLLINPANNQPFYVGITRQKDGLIESGDGDEVTWRAGVFAAVHSAKKTVQVVEIERVEGMASAKTAKQFWIEMLARANAKLINNERPKDARIAAHRFHVASCCLPDSDYRSSLALSSSCRAEIAGEARILPRLPMRHGEKWSTEETSSVQKMYERGVRLRMIADDRDRKATSILARLAKLAKSDSRLATRLRADGLLKSDGSPNFANLS